MKQQLFEEVDNYITGLFPEGMSELNNTNENIRRNGLPDISVSPAQGQLLQVLALSCKAKRILEIGTLGGYSTIWMAKALPQGGKLITIESEPKHAAVALQNIREAQLHDTVEIKEGKALDVLQTLRGAEPFDLIFIDADKLPYTEYFQEALKLSKSGTTIICDNVIRGGRVLDKNSMDDNVKGVQRLNQYLSTCTAVTATILQTVGAKEHDGMAIAIVK
jgi:predicted O-methyltransferase YrrM